MKFSKGDKVRVISEHTVNGVGYSEVEVGDIVTVECARGMWGVPTYQVRRADGGISMIDATCLELRYTFDPGGERISFEYVRVGDVIAAYTYGRWDIAEVGKVFPSWAADTRYDVLAYAVTTTDIRLLHRPETGVDEKKVTDLADLIVKVDPRKRLDTTDLAEALVKAGVSFGV